MKDFVLKRSLDFTHSVSKLRFFRDGVRDWLHTTVSQLVRVARTAPFDIGRKRCVLTSLEDRDGSATWYR